MISRPSVQLFVKVEAMGLTRGMNGISSILATYLALPPEFPSTSRA